MGKSKTPIPDPRDSGSRGDGRPEKGGEVQDTELSPSRVDEIRKRILEGYYESDEVIRSVAEKLVGD